MMHAPRGWLGKYLAMRADLGRPIGPTQVPLARRYCELELRARDLYAALHDDPLNGRIHEMHISATRAQSALAAQLGESITTMRHLFEKPRSVLAEIAEAAARERQALLEAPADAVN